MITTKALPLDVKLMDFVTMLLLIGFLTALAMVTFRLALRAPVLSLREVVVVGDLERNNLATLRTQLGQSMAGSFALLDLNRARDLVQAVPWVRKAVVKREFPNRLRIRLQEHQAVAFWGVEGEPRLLNTYGEIFDANTGEVEQDSLPRLFGPDGQAQVVLEAYQQLAPQFNAVRLALVQLEMSSLGGWQARLESGAQLHLGRGSLSELSSRVADFLGTLPGVAAKYGRRTDALESADLRHKDGYAVKLRGVTTGNPQKTTKNEQ